MRWARKEKNGNRFGSQKGIETGYVNRTQTEYRNRTVYRNRTEEVEKETVCGNDKCEYDESWKTCPADCEAPTCPKCPEPTGWSKCVNGTQNRTNYNCSEGTDYECEPYTETESCKIPKKPVCGNNKCEEGENYTTCSQDCPKPPAKGAGGITGRIIGSTAGQGAIVASVLILVGIIGVYWFKKNLR